MSRRHACACAGHSWPVISSIWHDSTGATTPCIQNGVCTILFHKNVLYVAKCYFLLFVQVSRIFMVHRLGGAKDEQTLANTSKSAPTSASGRLYLLKNDSPAPHFISECFYLTQRAVYSCIIPAGMANKIYSTMLRKRLHCASSSPPML